MKQTPKSCSCQHCTRGKHTKAGHELMNYDERALRRAEKCKLDYAVKHNYNIDLLEEVVNDVAPIGNYYD